MPYGLSRRTVLSASAAAVTIVVAVVLALVFSGGHATRSHGQQQSTTSQKTAVALTIIVTLDRQLRERKYNIFVEFTDNHLPVLLRPLPAKGKLILSALPTRTLNKQHLVASEVSFTASPCKGQCDLFHGGVSLGYVQLHPGAKLTIRLAPRCRIVGSKRRSSLECASPGVQTQS